MPEESGKLILKSEHSLFVGERFERDGFRNEIWELGRGPNVRKIRAAYISPERLVELKKRYAQLSGYDKATKDYGLKLDALVKEQWKFAYHGQSGFLIQLVAQNGKYDLIPHRVSKCLRDEPAREEPPIDFQEVTEDETKKERESQKQAPPPKTSGTGRLPETKSSNSSGLLGAYVPSKEKLQRSVDKYNRTKPSLTEKKVTLAEAEEKVRKGLM